MNHIYRKRKNNKEKYKLFIYISSLLLIFIFTFIFFYSSSDSSWKVDNNNVSQINLVNSDTKITKKWNENIKKDDYKTQKSLNNIQENNEDLKDFISDNSITKFVSPEKSFLDLNYEPNDLVKIDSKYIILSKNGLQLRNIALESLENLSYDFYNYFKVSLVIVSAYRDYSYQKWIETNNKDCITQKLCAKVWYSEHQTWLAIDIFEASTKEDFLWNPNYKKYFDWMNKNAYKYGFHNSYQKWIEIDWYWIEPWHWRYLGVDMSTQLKEKWITFSQYYNSIKK